MSSVNPSIYPSSPVSLGPGSQCSLDTFDILKSENYKIITFYLSAEPAMASQSGVSSLSLKTITVRIRRQNSQVETVTLGKTDNYLLTV